jgi:peroxiredoxin
MTTTKRRALLHRATMIAAVALAAGVATLMFGPDASAKPDTLAIGKPAPDFSGTDTAGRSIRLSELKGKTVVLEWTNHDCPYVVKHYSSQNMQKLQKDARELGIVWLSVISSAPGEQGHVSPAEADKLTKDRGAAPSAVLLDPAGKIGRAYAARTTPHMFVIDKDGLLQYMGGIDDKASSSTSDVAGAKSYVRLALASVQKGEKVKDAVTRPYGCSVKYK